MKSVWSPQSCRATISAAMRAQTPASSGTPATVSNVRPASAGARPAGEMRRVVLLAVGEDVHAEAARRA